MNLQAWQAAARHNLARLTGRLRQLAPGTLYGFLSATTLLPVVTAANQGDFAALVTLGSVMGGIGGNLVANQIQAWKDSSEAELAAELQQAAAADPAWRQELDTVLEKLDAIQTVQAAVTPAERTWFGETLRHELTSLGNLPRFEAILSGKGAIAQGKDAMAASERSIAAQRLEGLAITGDNNLVQFILRQYQAAPGKALADDALRGHIERYLKWVGERYGVIELRGIERQGRQVIQLDLDTVYVPLAAADFQAVGPGREIRLDQILDCGPRLVITGGPGSGKTTVLQHIAWTLTLALFQDQPRLAAARVGLRLAQGEALPLPIFVPLSAYAQHRRSLPADAAPERRTLAHFISHYLIDKQSTLRLPTDFFTRLLNAGQAVLLLLDGLDEVPDDDLRAEVSGAIEDLVLGKEKLRVVATCRTVAYKERTVLGRGFREVQVRPLAAEHIERLVTQAYAAIHPADADAQRAKRTLLLDGIRNLEAARQGRLGKETEPLVTSPLLVRLLLIVQENEQRLPDQRAELYAKATDNLLLPDYLLDRDAANRLGRLIENKETHRELVQHLAYHMHQRGEQQGRDIDEDGLRQVFAGTRYAGLASDLIKITRLRGTLLEERNRRYRFIHLSFQEFLAARYLAEVVRGVDGIARFLEGGPILESWWREPALLVIGYLSKASPSTAQELLRRLAGVDAEAAARNVSPSADVQMAAATVAATAFREWSPWQVGEAALKQEIVQRLLTLFQNPALTAAAQPTWRAAVGDSLARLGDPRVEAMTIEGMEFCYVPAGRFLMGSGNDDKLADRNEKPQHPVDLDCGYWLGRYPVTNAQYAAFVAAGGYNESGYWPEARLAGFWRSGEFKGRDDATWRRRPDPFGEPYDLSNHPVVGLSWYEALAFVRWLSDQARPWLPAGWEARLPSEAEWEKAARGGEEIVTAPVIGRLGAGLAARLSVRLSAHAEGSPKSAAPGAARQPNLEPRRAYPWGEDFTPNRANYDDTGIGATSAVGCFPLGASPYGVEELSGNVWEWTRSLWGSYPYPNHMADRARRENLKAGKDEMRVLRGNSFYGNETGVRCAHRVGLNPDDLDGDSGFRVVVSP